ncbi:putative calcium-binding protein CML45 [Curcuma longa]|uniref:putative calcium-binding protein CML45 n=1 Tax=Curcuma longa TaxID=136217 RepID=UPI003D9F6AD8
MATLPTPLQFTPSTNLPLRRLLRTFLHPPTPPTNAFPFLLLFSRQTIIIIVASSSMEMLYYLLESLTNNLSFSSSSQKRPSSASPTAAKRGGDLDRIGREEMAIVMAAIGLQERGRGGPSAMECSADQLCGLFEEKEPSLEEVKQAFLVFDENGDGFIDAAELQSVLRRLGFAEGAELEACREMIRVYDENEDGKIGFSEFVKFMERGFC